MVLQPTEKAVPKIEPTQEPTPAFALPPSYVETYSVSWVSLSPHFSQKHTASLEYLILWCRNKIAIKIFTNLTGMRMRHLYKLSPILNTQA